MDKKVVTRFAPSPTGFLHVGGVRTALYAWLLAQKNKGVFILRIEDTDKEREVAGSVGHIIESLNWLGLNFEKGLPGSELEGHYLQSKRLHIYKKYADMLVKAGHAYPDPYTEDEVSVWREAAELARKPFLYREHRPENPGVWDGTKGLRFKTPEIKSYKWHDMVYGDLSAGPEALDDFILIKADGYPTYNFAHVVDDIEMEVTHVLRGEEFISSTPKFLSLYQALGIEPPAYATLPVILGPDGKKKLSKRDGAKDLLDYRTEGYIPEAFVNFLALLGWNPGNDREIFSVPELTQTFDLARVQNSGAQMNQTKLDWINKEHIKKLSQKEIEENILERLPENMRNPKLVPMLAERISKWGDVKEIVAAGELDFFFEAPAYDKTKLAFKDTPLEKISENLKLAIKSLDTLSESNFTAENIKNILMQIAVILPSKGEILHPVRYALSGRDKSPDPFIIAEILGKNETLSRLQKAV